MTDHKPLVGIFAKPLVDLENERLLRFRLKLADYSLRVTWTPGKTHLIADALSRAPVFDPPEEEDPDVDNEVVCNAVVVASDPLLQEMCEAAAADQDYCSVVKAVLQGKNVSDLPKWHMAKKFKNIWKDVSIAEEVLLCISATRIIVPVAMRKKILSQLHFSHAGIQRTVELARQLFFWPKMRKDVINMIDTCEECQQLRASQAREPEQSLPEAVSPMQSVSTDPWS